MLYPKLPPNLFIERKPKRITSRTNLPGGGSRVTLECGHAVTRAERNAFAGNLSIICPVCTESTFSRAPDYETKAQT